MEQSTCGPLYEQVRHVEAGSGEFSAVTSDARIPHIIRAISRAHAMEHSGRSFLEHLLGTWRILTRWKMPAAVCRAGLLHSAYSTVYYPYGLYSLRQRGQVRALIGQRAEALVFHFCSMKRDEIWPMMYRRQQTLTPMFYRSRHPGHDRVRLTRQTAGRLLLIECANIAEQARASDGGPSPWMWQLLQWWSLLEQCLRPVRLQTDHRLTKRADEAAIKLYLTACRCSGRIAVRHLDQAIILNPWAGELRLLRALHQYHLRDYPGAAADARAAHRLLTQWGVAWDKRVPLEISLRLAGAISRKRLSREEGMQFVALTSG